MTPQAENPAVEMERRMARDRFNSARHALSQWTSCFGTLAQVRTIINKDLDGAYAAHYDPEQIEVLESAVKNINRMAGYANNMRVEAEAILAQAHTAIFPPTIDDSQFAELGERMAADPSQISTNIDGSAYLAHCDKLKREKVANEDCCGGKPDSNGFCYGFGMCPRFQQIKKCTSFATDVVRWAGDVHEQSGLAAVAARLSDGSVISSEVSNV